MKCKESFMLNALKFILSIAVVVGYSTDVGAAPSHTLSLAGAYEVAVQINGAEPTPINLTRRQNLELLISQTLAGAGVPIVKSKFPEEQADSAIAALTYYEHNWDINLRGFLPGKGYELGLRVVEAARLSRDKNILVPAVVYHDANFGQSSSEALEQNIGDHRVALFQKFLGVHRGTRDETELRTGKNAAEIGRKALSEARHTPFRSLRGLRNAVICVFTDPTIPGSNRLRMNVQNDLARKLDGIGIKVQIAKPDTTLDLAAVLTRNDCYIEITLEGFIMKSDGQRTGGMISHVGIDVWQQINPINQPDKTMPAVTYSEERVGHVVNNLVEAESRVAAELASELKLRIAAERN